MSYCRWSSDDYQCDAYVYASARGFEIHLAGARLAFREPLPPMVPFTQANIDAFVARAARVGEMVDAATRVPLALPHAGESFTCATAGECADRLDALRALGYRIPQGAIDALRAEAADAEAGNRTD